MYGKIILFLLPIIVLGFLIPQNAFAEIKIDPASIYLNDNGSYVPYKLTQNSTSITINSKEGSYVFDKNTCSIAFYNGKDTNHKPIIGSDVYSVLASYGSTGTWSPVSIINNAVCNTVISENSGTVTLTGSKYVSGAGLFSINYTKSPLKPLKLTFSATNNNPTWTNYHVGMQETIQVPKMISLGNQTFDLSLYNNTIVNRNWITSHSSQLLKLSANTYYDMGVGWNNVNDVLIQYINNKAYLTIDYTYNTPILSPGQTITIDPAIGFNTFTDTAVGTAGSTSTASITIGSNSNRLLVAHLVYQSVSPTVTSVKIGSTSFTHLTKQALGSSVYIDTYYLINPPTGSQTVTVTWGASGYTAVSVGLVSFYNVDQTTGINISSVNSTNSGNVDPQTINITPTRIGSWIVQYGVTSNVFTSATFSNTEIYGDGSAGVANAAQYNSSPTIGSKNTLSITRGNTATITGSIAYEIKPFTAPSPSSPTISKVNTINSTAINATWNKPTGTTWFWANFTLSGGATTHINTTQTTLTLNNFTAGSKYTLAVAAGNSSGTSSSSLTKYNYTFNVAPTVPTLSSITSSQMRLGWTNPTGGANLTGGFNIYKVSGIGTNYTLLAQSSNNTNHYDPTSLQGNREYTFKIATRYAVGTNYTGASSNSTTVSAYTLPSVPTSLSASQTLPLKVILSWTRPNDNGTVSGYKVERSLNNISWSVLTANTGNDTTQYTDVVSASGKYYYRVSAIQYSGTSSPSNTASITAYDIFTVREYHANNITPVYGQSIQSNLTSSNNRFTLVSGVTTINGLTNNNNFTAWNSLINFIVGKQYNYNATANHSLNMTTKDFDVDCPSTGTGVDVEVWTNGTNGHNITTFSTPTCFANNTMKWSTKFTANGNDVNSYNTLVYVKAVNATFGTVAPLKYNQTKVTTAFTDPYIVSNPVSVGTGLQTKLFNWSMNLTVSPAFTPVNFTVGHISVSGVNPVTVPIKFSATNVNSSATAVTVSFPSTYTMGYNVTFGNEGTSHTYTGLPVTSPTLGTSQSVITFKNPANDFVTIKAYDLTSKTSGSYIMSQPNTNVPFVTQFTNFKNGLFGTSAMIGGINIVDLIVLIVAMIGLNRANEIVGAFMMVIIVGVAGFFQIITWPTAMVSGIALAVLVTVVTMKKYQNS